MYRLGAVVQGVVLGVLLFIAMMVALGEGAASAVFRYQGF
jgi:hypothetical protein